MTFARVTGGLLAGAIALSGACGERATGGGDAGEPASAPASAAARNTCGLVNLEEIAAIAGTTLTALHDVQSDTETACELRGETGTDVPLVTVSVLWAGGKAQAEAERAGMAMAKGLLNEPGVDIEELTGSGTEPGLADAAYYSNLMPSWVLKGDVLIQVISPTFEADRTRRTFLAVAKTAVARLGAGQ
jgi:hypothetical protein